MSVVSIIIPCYNQSQYLAEALKSVVEQPFADWELIVVNDGSTDDTTGVAKKLIAAHPERNIHLIEQPNGGLARARNAGISASRGKYVLPLNADDMLHPDFLMDTVALLEGNTELSIAYTAVQAFGLSNDELPTEDWDPARLRFTKQLFYCALYRREVWEQVGGYNPDMLCPGYEDWDFWIGCLEKRLVGRRIPQRLFFYRTGEEGMSSAALKNDAALRAQIVLLHPSLYDAAKIRWAQAGFAAAIGEEKLAGELAATPGNFDIMELLAIFHLEHNHYLEAAKLFNAILRQQPGNVRVLSSMAETLLKSGDRETARLVLEQILTVQPGHVEASKILKDLEKGAQKINDAPYIHPPAGRFAGKPRLKITYLISSILGGTGGNITLLNQANAMADRGHEVTIVTYTDKPEWAAIKAKIIKVQPGKAMCPLVPPSDVVISTYFLNTLELRKISARLKIYFAQGDQYVFQDSKLQAGADKNSQTMAELSRQSYLVPGMKFLPNSWNLARAVEESCGRKPDAILPVCVDRGLFRPLKKSIRGSRLRILIVGPDNRGSALEPLTFKGMMDIRQGLEILSKKFVNFTAVRMASSGAEIFKDFPCEYYHLPDDSMKTFLYGAAHVLVYASHYDSCPRPPLEAMSAGTPVICTDTGGAREYCRDGENCLMVPVKSPEAIASALERLILNPPLQADLIQGGLATAANRPMEREWDELEAFCYNALEE